MTDDGPTLDDALRRALDAAELANDAAEDLARLGRGQVEFANRVTAAHKRTTAIATGAALGALVSLGLASLVYFRSVGDLHEAAGLQAETARLMAEEIAALRKTREETGTGMEELKTLVAALPADVGAAIAAQAAAEPDAPPATDPALVAEVQGARDEILAALAEMQVGAGLPAAGAPDLAETLTRIEAGLLRLSAAPAVPRETAPEPRPAEPRASDSRPAEPRAAGSRAPSPRPAAAEANPFSYP